MHGVAGTSAVEGYRSARSQRRGGSVAGVALLAAASAAGWAAVHLAGGARVVFGALGAAGLVLAWLVRPRPDAARWLRGAAGEAATALLLDRLPARRWAVLHDLGVPGSRANVDHLVVGPSGVWVVDTKTTRATVQARWRTVRFGDRRLDAGPTEWEAQVVADRLGIPVRALIVVHGEGLRRRGGRCGEVGVVPADGLLRRLRRGRRRLDRAEIARLADRAEAIFPPVRMPLEKRGTPRG